VQTQTEQCFVDDCLNNYKQRVFVCIAHGKVRAARHYYAFFQDAFVKRHGIKLGFMSAFVKASAYGLQQMPVVNAVIDGQEIVYRDYVDISVAVATPKVRFIVLFSDPGTVDCRLGFSLTLSLFAGLLG